MTLLTYVRTYPYSAGLLALTLAAISFLGVLVLTFYYSNAPFDDFIKETFLNATMGLLFVLALNCVHLMVLLYSKQWVIAGVTGILLGVGYKIMILAGSMIT